MNEFFTGIKEIFFPDETRFLTFFNGNSNIILSAPHGGNLKPFSIPRRTYGNRSRDTYTKELINQIALNLKQKSYVIFSNIHRSRIDLNRDIDEACQGNKSMEKLWNRWNYILDSFMNSVRYYHKKGLYIDIHSHNNHDKFMIGYGLNAKDYLHLLKDDKIPTKNSTMHSLKEYDPNYYKTEHNILFGKYSIYSSIKGAGFSVLIPEDDKHFLNGGRNIERFHGSGIGSMQIECPISILKYNIPYTSQIISNAIELFSKKYLIGN